MCAQAQEASQPHPNPTPRNPNPTPRKPRNPTPHFRKCGAVFRAWPGSTRAIIFCDFPALQATNFRVQSLLLTEIISQVKSRNDPKSKTAQGVPPFPPISMLKCSFSWPRCACVSAEIISQVAQHESATTLKLGARGARRHLGRGLRPPTLSLLVQALLLHLRNFFRQLLIIV